MSEPIAGAGGTVESTKQGDFFDEDALLDRPSEGIGEPTSTTPVTPTTPSSAATQAITPAAAPVPPPVATVDGQLDDDTLSRLRSANLRPIVGETREEALIRVADQNSGRAIRTWNELKAIKTALDSQRQLLEPLLRAYHQERTRAETEAAAARIPDKEADREGYSLWLSEELLRRQVEREDTEAQRTEQEAQATAALDIDEQAVGALEVAVDSDPEVRAAYEFITSAALRQAELRFPNESPEKRLELVQVSQMLDMRNMAARGIDVVETVRATYRDARTALGLGEFVAPTAAPTTEQPTPPPPAASTSTPSAPPTPAVSPTAARLAAAAAAAPARAAVSPAGSAAAPSGLEIDTTGMSEDEFVDFALENPGVVDDIIKRKYGKESRF